MGVPLPHRDIETHRNYLCFVDIRNVALCPLVCSLYIYILLRPWFSFPTVSPFLYPPFPHFLPSTGIWALQVEELHLYTLAEFCINPCTNEAQSAKCLLLNSSLFFCLFSFFNLTFCFSHVLFLTPDRVAVQKCPLWYLGIKQMAVCCEHNVHTDACIMQHVGN